MADSTVVNGDSDSSSPQFSWNALFRGDHEMGAYNACVGDNGAPDLYYYADGFADSVDLLIDALTKGHEGLLDTLIYPIGFSLRHSVELTLKGQIQELIELALLRKRPLVPATDIDRVLNQHDIGGLWTFFSGHAVAFDLRYKELVSALDSLIRCIAETDPTGQTFRYSYSTEAKKHLTDVSVINVLVLRDQFRIIRGKLKELTAMSQWLSREYSTRTFTANLSREDLRTIATQLPARQSWSDPTAGLDAIKTSVKSEYSIGSKEWTEALSKIQHSRDLARIIGMPVNIPGLSMTDLITLNDLWKLAWDRDALSQELRNDISGAAAPKTETLSMRQIIEHELRMKKDTKSSFAQFLQWATPERLAGLLSLMDARDYCFSEEHDMGYESYKEEMNAAFSGNSQALEAELSEIWSQSIGRRTYPSRVIALLKHTGFTHESAALEENLFS